MRSSLKSGLLAVVIVTGMRLCFAQTATLQIPQRGVVPLGFYEQSKIETIDAVSGNLALHIPLAGLPPGRAGFSAAVDLFYNSSMYAHQTTYFLQSPGNLVALETLVRSSKIDPNDTGGWHYGFQYSFVTDYGPPADCSIGQPGNVGTLRYRIVFPDGSSHTLFISGKTDLSNIGPGYYGYDLNTCGPPVEAGNLSLYTADGTYLQVAWNASTGAWTLSFPDGRIVQGSGALIGGVNWQFAGFSASASDLYDRNGNRININRVTSQDGTLTTTLTEQLTSGPGRTITISHPPSGNDTITQAGYNQQILTWTISWINNTLPHDIAHSYSCYTDTCYGDILGTLVVGGIQLPNSLSYQFCYAGAVVQLGGCSNVNNVTQWGLLSYMQLPTGASVQYTYPTQPNWAPWGTTFPVSSKSLKWTDPYDSSLRTETTSYSFYLTQSVFTNPDGEVITHSFYDPTIPNFPGGLVYKTVNQQTGDVLEQVWATNAPYGQSSNWPSNPSVQWELRSVGPSGSPSLAAAKFFTYDRNGNQTGVSEYDWASYGSVTHQSTSGQNPGVNPATGLSGGTVLRSTANTYVNGANTAAPADDSWGYWRPHSPQLLNLISQSTVTGAGPGSITQFSYDCGTGLTHGNLTQENHWDTASSTWLTIKHGYDSGNPSTCVSNGFGNPTYVTDARGNSTVYSYDANNLYVTQMVQASGTAVARTFTFQHDYYSGALTQKNDSNHSITTNLDYDQFGRNKTIQESSVRTTTTDYFDSALQITGKKIDPTGIDATLVENAYVDPLGRPGRSVDAAGNTIQKRYFVGTTPSTCGDTFTGTFDLVSNPFLTGSEGTMGWTRTVRDTAGRVIQVRQYSGSQPPPPWGANCTTTGTATSSYSADTPTSTFCATSLDEGAVSRKSCTDALGRLKSVTENGIGATTTYGYDSLDNLTSVTQGSTVRTFTYSSLKRLLTASNPENVGSITNCYGSTVTASYCYTYDPNGNLLTKTDARNVKTTFVYDALDQVISKTYNDTPQTPAVSYSYNYGWLTGVSSSASSYAYTHDPIGRINGGVQNTDGQNYTFTMSLRPFVGIGWIQYPNTGRKITTGYDPQGRATSVSGQIGAGTPTNYASSIGYWPQGAIQTMTQGNGLVTTTQYNSRLQPTSIQAGSLLNIANRYDPNPSADLNCSGALTTVAGNNGNVLAQTINGAGRIYSYDGVNRLCRAAQGVTWTESYAYDSRGNIGVSRSGSLPAVTAEVIGSTGAYGTNNRVSAWAYDQGGNLTGIPAAGGSTVRATCAAGTMAGTAMLRTACYDAENRMVSETDANGATSTYAYDGDGRRVSKTVNSVKTTFVYDPMGQLAQEYGGPAIPGSEVGTRYLTTDQLGSTRLVTDSSRNVSQSYDYLPFGQDFTLPTDSNRIRFTSKERDAETGLDYFGARYFSGAQGRFTSPDWSEKPEPVPYADFSNPQTLNLYSYGGNNPLRNRDLDGHCTADGEQHNWLWCAAHTIGLTQTVKEQADTARQALSQMHGFTIGGQTPADIAKNGNNQQVIAANRSATNFLVGVAMQSLAPCPPGVSCGVVPFGPPGELPLAGVTATRVETALQNITKGVQQYTRDGITFANRERILPAQPLGYYKEYTVPPAAGVANRGAERLIVGQGGEVYYTPDHYKSFARIK